MCVYACSGVAARGLDNRHVCVLHFMTYLSALTYSSSTGTQGTLPSLTPIWMSLNCRPRFSPRMVTLVPPWRGPVSGNNWTKEREEDRGRHKKEQVKMRKNEWILLLCLQHYNNDLYIHLSSFNYNYIVWTCPHKMHIHV